MSLAISQGEGARVSPVVPLLILAVPVTDAVVVMLKRILRCESPFKPDKYHLHHIFLRYGMGRDGAVKVILYLSGSLCLLSLLGPLKKLPDYGLFLIYIGYFVAYIFSSVYIIWIFRYGKMFREKKDSLIEKNWLLGPVAQRFHLLHLFRKSPRYSVNLEIECCERERGICFQGTALNISTDGLMASIATLDRIYENVLIKIIFPLAAGAHSLELPAEHLWMHEHDGQFYHGFRFSTFDGNQQQLIFKFLVEYKKG